MVSAAPHIRSKDKTSEIMLDVLIALAFAALAGTFYFGYKALLIIVISVASALLFELLFQLVTKRKVTVTDCSAAVTGLLLALCLPASAPYWIPVIGAFFAIVIVKQLFGGIGQNFVNPALAARAFLLASYPAYMTNWSVTPVYADAATGATPLALLRQGFEPNMSDVWNAFLGKINGSIGETCAAALLIGGGYLLIRRIISWRIPVTYVGSFMLFTWLFGRNGAFAGFPLYEAVTGGVLMGAMFMATDYATSPVTAKGQLIMGLGCGLINALIRVYGGYPEGTTYAILLMNLAVPLIDKFTKPRIYGEVRRVAGNN